jgi:hypothetical protein
MPSVRCARRAFQLPLAIDAAVVITMKKKYKGQKFPDVYLPAFVEFNKQQPGE